MAERFNVEVDADQFEELCKPSQPLAAVAELVWNCLDAEADTVDIVLGRTELDAVESVKVIDSGHGMTYEEAVRDFRKLGGSWKKGRKLSKNNLRAMHGKKGQGRFRAFAIGQEATWSSVADGLNGLQRTSVRGSLANSEFTVSDPEPLATGATGTTVAITGARPTANALLGAGAADWLVTRLAAYLAKYPQVVVSYDGKRLDPAKITERDSTQTLDPALAGDFGTPELRIVEWKPTIVGLKPSIVLCDEDGVALHELEDLVVGRLKLTAYISWAGFAAHERELLLAEMGHAVLQPVIMAGRQEVAAYVAARAAEDRRAVVDDWKARNVYPYKQPPSTTAEVRERELFDAVAVTAASSVSDDPKAARLSLRLIKEALEQSPGALHRVMHEVLDLTPEQLADFDKLLRTASLPAVIAATAKVTDRLSFLDDLHRLLFDADGKKVVRERDHLHEILASDRTWVFGEEYSLAVSDKTLTKVLAAHLALLGAEAPVLGRVADAGGNTARRVDLMLSKAANGPSGRRHLVVELKRPSVRLGQAELSQITNYAVAVAKDAAFRSPDVTWDFWLVGDDYDDIIDETVHQDGRPEGVAAQKHPYTIRVRRWAEIIEENRQRLHFYREHLAYAAEEDATVEETLAKYRPKPDSE